MILAQIHTLCESSVLFRVSSMQSADFFYKIMAFLGFLKKNPLPRLSHVALIGSLKIGNLGKFEDFFL